MIYMWYDGHLGERSELDLLSPTEDVLYRGVSRRSVRKFKLSFIKQDTFVKLRSHSVRLPAKYRKYYPLIVSCFSVCERQDLPMVPLSYRKIYLKIHTRNCQKIPLKARVFCL